MFMLVDVDTEALQPYCFDRDNLIPEINLRSGFTSSNCRTCKHSFEEAKSAVEKTVREEKLQRAVATVERSQGVMFSETHFGRE
jgi:hypothetical protein